MLMTFVGAQHDDADAHQHTLRTHYSITDLCGKSSFILSIVADNQSIEHPVSMVIVMIIAVLNIYLMDSYYINSMCVCLVDHCSSHPTAHDLPIHCAQLCGWLLPQSNMPFFASSVDRCCSKISDPTPTEENVSNNAARSRKINDG